jgi:hypothetical protein
MFTLFSSLFFYVWAHSETIAGSAMSGAAPLGGFTVWFQNTSMDFHDERYLIVSIYIAVLLPQLMSYLVSGIFGCANRLIPVEWITAAVTWLVIKFLAVLAGILMAQAIAALYAAPYLHPADLPKKLLQSIMMISLSFVIAGIFYFTYEYRFKRLLVTIRRPFKPLTRYMPSYAASAEAEQPRRCGMLAQARAEAGERSSLELGHPRNRAERWPGPVRSQIRAGDFKRLDSTEPGAAQRLSHNAN